MILGIELGDAVVVAVSTDDQGGVASRSSHDSVSPAVAAKAAQAVATGDARETLGIAVGNPLDPAVAPLIEAAAHGAGAAAPPRIVTSGTAFALGEQWCGAAQGADYVVALNIRSRVHGGIVLKGQPFEGAHGLAGLAAWLSLNPVDREDYRKVGCLDAEIGTAGVVRRLVWRLKAGDTSSALEKAGGSIASITVEHVFEAAQEGDGVASGVVRDTARYVGMAIGNLVAVVDPDVVVVGGIAAASREPFVDLVRLEAKRRVQSAVATSLTILAAALADDAVALGAARAATLAR